MVVILDYNEDSLQFLDDDLLEMSITDTYDGYQVLELTYKLTDTQRDKQLFKQGNKIFTGNCLFLINSEVSFDYIDKTINIEAEEIIVELHNTEPVYYKDNKYSSHITGHTLTVSQLFLQRLLQSFYKVKTTDLEKIDDKITIPLNGSITKYDLLKLIEQESGMMFKREYSLKDNRVVKEISLLLPENYGVTHNSVVESVQLGFNANELEYSSDETKNATGVSVIIDKEEFSSSDVDYDKILEQFYSLDINNNIQPTRFRYEFFTSDITVMAGKVRYYVETYGYLPERVTVSHEETFTTPENEELTGEVVDHDKVYSVDVGMGQALYLMSECIQLLNTPAPDPLEGTGGDEEGDSVDYVELELIQCPRTVGDVASNVSTVFSKEEVYDLAVKTSDYCLNHGAAPSFFNLDVGQLSFEGLVYLFSKHLYNNMGKVFLDSHDLSLLFRVHPSFVQSQLYYRLDYNNYEYLPFLYSQNSSEKSGVPYTLSDFQLEGMNVYDVDNYISESYPTLVVKKTAGATLLGVEVSCTSIVDDAEQDFSVYFKDPSSIEDNSEITINFKDPKLSFKKYITTTTTKTVTETSSTSNTGTITATGYPTCSCCAGKTKYKKYTRTYKDKCPICGRTGTLVYNPKGVADGEITCGNTGPYCKTGGSKNGKSLSRGSVKGCDADYCVYDGGDKGSSSRCKKYKLTPAEAKTSTTTTKTVTETAGEYKEVTADNSGETSDTNFKLSDIVTGQSSFKEWHGDVTFKLKGCTMVSLSCEDTKLYECSRFPYVKPHGTLYIYTPACNVDFNYTLTSESPKLESFETSEQSVEEVLIGAWKKLNGDDTQWLERNEDITVSLVESHGVTYNTGDYIYIKLPDQEVFKAQITEVSYNPLVNGSKEFKIGNVVRSTIR